MRIGILMALCCSLAAIQISDFSGEEAESFFRGECTAEIVEGEEMPISFSAKGDILEIDDGILIFKKDLFARCNDNELPQLSLDGIEWYRWDKLLTGRLSLSIADGKVSFELECNLRED